MDWGNRFTAITAALFATFALFTTPAFADDAVPTSQDMSILAGIPVMPAMSATELAAVERAWFGSRLVALSLPS